MGPLEWDPLGGEGSERNSYPAVVLYEVMRNCWRSLWVCGTDLFMTALTLTGSIWILLALTTNPRNDISVTWN